MKNTIISMIVRQNKKTVTSRLAGSFNFPTFLKLLSCSPSLKFGMSSFPAVPYSLSSSPSPHFTLPWLQSMKITHFTSKKKENLRYGLVKCAVDICLGWFQISFAWGFLRNFGCSFCLLVAGYITILLDSLSIL